jgi:formylglycine-generating enzyme required for sulfatase activity
MGSPTTEEGRYEDEIQHKVTITKGFWICDHEVTQAEYEDIMGNNPSNWRGPNRPVERVTYEQATSYCTKLTKRERSNGKITLQEEYRLPTEAEWEYAARAGTSSNRYGDLESIAWYDANSQNETKNVKNKTPNGWGLYDTIGNVWEWCLDWYGDYSQEPITDPQGPPDKVLPGWRRVIRGGSIFFAPEVCRSAYRDWLEYSAPNDDVGFRPVLSSVR